MSFPGNDVSRPFGTGEFQGEGPKAKALGYYHDLPSGDIRGRASPARLDVNPVRSGVEGARAVNEARVMKTRPPTSSFE